MFFQIDSSYNFALQKICLAANSKRIDTRTLFVDSPKKLIQIAFKGAKLANFVTHCDFR